MTWTDERIAILKHDWTDGYSASQIAQRLGDVTRNAVIGKVHRLGLAGRAHPSRYCQAARRRSPSSTLRTRARDRPQSRPRPVRQSGAPATPALPPMLPELGAPPASPITVQSLTSLTCRWPEGDPKTPDFHFCGRTKTRAELPYCDHHAAIAFR
jgi:GcrA cell cycle regulator